MPCVTLLVTGVPRHALSENLSRNLDLLFDTDEIGTFKLRNLPNHPRTNKRQVALDFRSGFDAMAAQAILNTFEYEYDGEMYTLYAKVNKVKDYMRSDSFSPEMTVEDQNWRWSTSSTIPDVYYDDNMYRATHSKLNAHLALLRKQKLIVEAERELLREKRKLKREYGFMDGHDSEYEATSSKHRRQGSRGRRSGSSRRRSREGHVVRGSRERRTRSRDSSRPRLAWDDRTRQLRSRSKERRSLSQKTHARDRLHRELRNPRSLILKKLARSKSRERSNSDEGVHPKADRPYRDPRSITRERYHRERRSRSNERDYRDQIVSRERGRERRSMSKERDYVYHIHSRERVHIDRRSTSRSRYYMERRSKERAVRRSRSRNRRSESRNRTHGDDVTVLSRSRDRHPLAIMPKPERSEAPRKWSLDAHGDANEPPMINVTIFKNEDGTKNINYGPTVQNRQVPNVPKENSKESDRIIEAEENGTVVNTKNQKENQVKKKIAKFNSKIRKAQLLELKIKSVTQNVKFLVFETLYELILESKCIISDSNQLLMEKTLEELVRERVEPLVRLRKDCDIGAVLHKYKLQYSKDTDVLLIRKMLEDISKTSDSPADTNTIKEADETSSDVAGQFTEMRDCSTQKTVTGVNKENEIQEDACSGSNPTNTETKESSENPQECDANIPKEHAENNDGNTDNSMCENIENVPQINGEIIETNGPTTIIDIDSPDKPVPKRPKFYLVIKALVKDMKRVIVNKNLTQLIKISDLEYVLRHTLRDLLKGQRYLPSKEIKNKFRSLHPKEKDDQFINNVINDIKDGKYPVLTGLPTIGDCEDDVILLENNYDVVIVEDSDDDDDDVTITGEQKVTPEIPTHYHFDSSLEISGTANLGTTNIDPEKHELAKDNPTKLEPSKPDTATYVPVVSGSINLGPSELRPNPGPCNLALVNSGPSDDTQVILNPLNIAQVEHYPSNRDASELRPTNPETSRCDLVNPGSANLSATAFRPEPGSSNAPQVIPGLYDLEQVNLDPLNVVRVNPESINNSTNFGPGLTGACKFLPACLRPTELRPALATSKIRPVPPGLATGAVKTMSLDSQATEKENTANIDKPGIMADTDKCKADENDTKTVKNDTYNANNSEDVEDKTGENNNSLKVTAITVVTSLNELAAITDKTADGPTMEVPIENIKGAIPFENSDTELIDTPSKFAPNQSSLVTSITDKANSENAKHNGNKAIAGTEDNSKNSLKVTAITIVTSLNELTKISDKTIHRSKMEVPIEDIKEEIPFENSEETDPTQNFDHFTSLTEKDNTQSIEDDRNKATERVEERNNNSLKVTAITIMTSLTELAAIADKSTDMSKIDIPVEEIKEEIETENSETEQIDATSKPASSHESKEVNGVKSYDKEKAMPKNTEGTNNDQVDNSSGAGIGRIVQENSNDRELTSSEKRTGHVKTASDEEDETIESIVKYVQSLLY